jgi:hypothetical protein
MLVLSMRLVEEHLICFIVECKSPFGKRDEGTAYLLQQFWEIRIASPYLPYPVNEGRDGVITILVPHILWFDWWLLRLSLQ